MQGSTCDMSCGVLPATCHAGFYLKATSMYWFNFLLTQFSNIIFFKTTTYLSQCYILAVLIFARNATQKISHKFQMMMNFTSMQVSYNVSAVNV
jgi:hypothetical protein